MTSQRVKRLIKIAQLVNLLPVLALVMLMNYDLSQRVYFFSLLPCALGGLVLGYVTKFQINKEQETLKVSTVRLIWVSIFLSSGSVVFLGVVYAMLDSI